MNLFEKYLSPGDWDALKKNEWVAIDCPMFKTWHDSVVRDFARLLDDIIVKNTYFPSIDNIQDLLFPESPSRRFEHSEASEMLKAIFILRNIGDADWDTLEVLFDSTY